MSTEQEKLYDLFKNLGRIVESDDDRRKKLAQAILEKLKRRAEPHHIDWPGPR